MTSRTRDSRGRFRRTLHGAARDRQAAELHARGRSYQQIADTLGYGSRGLAFDAVQRAFADLPAEGAGQARRLDLDRLDRLIERAWGLLEDDRTALLAIDRITRLLERRARLFGYDAPATSRVDVTMYSGVEAEIARLAAELGVTDG